MTRKTQTEVTETSNRGVPFTEAFKQFIPQHWAPHPDKLPPRLDAADPAAARRLRLAAEFGKQRLVIPAGELKQRAGDTDYRFRPHSAFAWLTGLGADREPGAVLVIEDAQATLFFKPRAPRTDPEFYADSRHGEMWVGARESLAEMSAITGLSCAELGDLEASLAAELPTTGIRLLREADPSITAAVDALRTKAGVDSTTATAADNAFDVALSEARMIKDDFEIDQLEKACQATAAGFEAVVAALPQAISRGRGERWVEGVFGLHARHAGNAVGYETIAAAGDHANTLHWIRNDGDLAPGDLLLLDAGVELDSLYTADITRTLPTSGRFTDTQRKVYQVVLEAHAAALAAARPGNKFSEVHAAAIKVIATRLEEWGLLPVSAEESLDPERGGHHRRWMVHGTSHHLGLDVHDCGRARRENYRDAELRPGMVITIEPGLYFKSTDLLVPPELRGIGVRIEDDIVITAEGNRILSHHLPRDPDEVEAWMAPLLRPQPGASIIGTA